MIYQKAPENEVYEMQPIRCQHQVSIDLVTRWQDRVKSGEWPLKGQAEIKVPKEGWYAYRSKE